MRSERVRSKKRKSTVNKFYNLDKKLKIYRFISRVFFSIAIASFVSYIALYLLFQINNNILSSQIKNTNDDLIISKQGYFENRNQNFDDDYIENTDNVISYFSNNNVSNLTFTSSIKYSAVINIDDKEAIKNIYAIDSDMLEMIIPKSEDYKIKDFNKYDLVIDNKLANELGLRENDQIIINFSGQDFMHYADLFNVKAISDIQNISMKNALIISKDYLEDVINIDNLSSEIYVNIDKKSHQDEIDDIEALATIFANNSLGLDVHTKYDIINGYEAYLSILNFSIFIQPVIFFVIFLLLSSIFIKSRYNYISYLIEKIRSKHIVFIIAGAEAIVCSAIFVFITILLSMRFIILQNYINVYILIMNIVSILLILALIYLVCYIKAKKEMSW